MNKIFYNAQSQFTEIWESYGGTPVSVVGNVMRAGPSTSSMAVGIDHKIIGSTGKARLYASDNLFQGNFRYLADDLDQISVGKSEEHTSELQSLMRISYAVFCLKKKKD